MTIGTTGEVQKMFRECIKAFHSSLIQEALLPVAEWGRNEARRKVKRGTGDGQDVQREHLVDAIFAVKGKRNDPSVIFGVSSKRAPHAHLVEYGTQTHIIRPKNKLWIKIGREFFSWVQHPGSRAFPYIRPAARALRRVAPDMIEMALRKMLGRHMARQIPQTGGEFL